MLLPLLGDSVGQLQIVLCGRGEFLAKLMQNLVAVLDLIQLARNFFTKGDNMIYSLAVLAFQTVHQRQPVLDLSQALRRGVDPLGVIAQHDTRILHRDARGFQRRQRLLKFDIVARQLFHMPDGRAQGSSAGGI